MAVKERAFDDQQLLKARGIFDKLSQPTNDFYKQIRGATTQQNEGNYRRQPGIAVMMPYQYFYQRLGESRHNEYPSYMDPGACISSELDDTIGILDYFPNWPEEVKAEDIERSYFSGGSELRINQHRPNDIREEVLGSFERFADQIAREWKSYQTRFTGYLPQ